jgi:predicted permease
MFNQGCLKSSMSGTGLNRVGDVLCKSNEHLRKMELSVVPGKIAARPTGSPMLETLTIALPVFGYVFWFAIPLLLFRGGAALTGGGDSSFDVAVLVAYFGASAAIYCLAFAMNALLFGGKGAEPPLAAMTAAYGNSVMMGIPLAELFFGADGLAIMTAIIACSAITYYGVTTVLIELRLGGSASALGIARETARALLRTPVILAMAAGLAFGALGLEMLPTAQRFVDIGAAAAAPTALFALGATLASFRIAGDLAEASVIGLLKLIANPLIAWVLAVPILKLDTMTAAAVIMMAALPCAVNPFLLASRYEAYTRRASAAIVLSTGVSIATVAFIVALVR